MENDSAEQASFRMGRAKIKEEVSCSSSVQHTYMISFSFLSAASWVRSPQLCKLTAPQTYFVPLLTRSGSAGLPYVVPMLVVTPIQIVASECWLLVEHSKSSSSIHGYY